MRPPAATVKAKVGWTGILAAVLCGAAYAYRIRVEERVLLRGVPYCARRTKRLIPCLI
ncbi:MAG TPA: hypothetical protein VEC02_00645 [Nitrososphaerales archaeon]|nr:hypothetical protein [Nitrososphaerales archaeon]